MSQGTFKVDGCQISYNLREKEEDVTMAISVDAAGSTVHGILSLRGFNRETGSITDCWFKRDESLPPGTMVIEPREQDA